jgi:hypothetical protein
MQYIFEPLDLGTPILGLLLALAGQGLEEIHGRSW